MRRQTRDLGFTLWGVLVFIYLFAPIAVIVAYSFNTGRILASWQGFGIDAYVRGINNDVIVSSVVTSLQAALGSEPGKESATDLASWGGDKLITMLITERIN